LSGSVPVWIIPGYGHVDPFIGRSAALAVFGHFIQFLDDHRAR
jgi:hypothetical protein